MRPVDVLTEHTLSFVRDAVGAPSGRVLEVGAGAGHLARALQDAGYRVVAIDRSEKAVTRAQGRGVDARQVDWHDFEDGGFDAVVFVRSLHHIDRLSEAADRCWPTLRAGGRAVVEEFSRADVDVPTAAWLNATLRELVSAGTIEVRDGWFLEAILKADDPHASWHEHHGHMHAAADMKAAFERRGRIVEERPVPYLYRYFCDSASDDDRGGELVEGIRRTEASLIDAGAIRGVGRRFVVEAR